MPTKPQPRRRRLSRRQRAAPRAPRPPRRVGSRGAAAPTPHLFFRAARSQVATGKAAAGKGHGSASGGKSAQWSGKRWNSWGSAGDYHGHSWGAADRGGEVNRKPRTPPRAVKRARP